MPLAIPVLEWVTLLHIVLNNRSTEKKSGFYAGINSDVNQDAIDNTSIVELQKLNVIAQEEAAETC